MAITSVGYPGTVDAVQWASMWALMGSVYSIGGPSDCQVVGTSTGCTIGAGKAASAGILDTVTSTPVALTAPGSGTAYWLVCLRRSWAAGSEATTAVAIGLGSSPPAVIPGSPTRNTTPGTLDDQPLAVVSWAAGAPSASVFADVRAVGAGESRVAYSTLALDPVKVPGVRVRVGSTDYVCDISAGVPVWSSSSSAGGSWVTTGFSAASTWTVASAAYKLSGGLCTLRVQAAPKTKKTPNSVGNFTDETILTVPVAARPGYRVPVPAETGFTAPTLRLDPDGTLKLVAGVPGGDIDTTEPLWVQVTYPTS